MIKTKEYEGTVQWAKDAPLTVLVDAITENRRYPSAIRDELRARLKATPGLTVSDLLWHQFLKAMEAQNSRRENSHKLEDLESSANPPGLFMIQLRDNREFWRWADRKHAFILGAEPMWKKCFDERLTTTPKEDLTDGELGLIKAFDKVLRDYNIDKNNDFQAFLNDNGDA
jgi:hypothetical protein